MREGDRSEYFAQVLLSAIGLSTPIPRQEDIGFDFVVNVSDQESGVLTFDSPCLVSVKSKSSPNIELSPTEAAIRINDKRHIEWLFRSETPAFLGVVDKEDFSIKIFSLLPIWFIFYENQSECGALVIKPRLDVNDTSAVGRPNKGTSITDWKNQYVFDVDLGHPIAAINLDTLKDRDTLKREKDKLRSAALLARLNYVHRNLGIPHFNWFATTSPEGESKGAFYSYAIENNAEVRKLILGKLAPTFISLALSYKDSGNMDKLSAIKTILEELDRAQFPSEVLTTLPEIFPN